MDKRDIRAWLPELFEQFDDEVYVHTIEGGGIYANASALRRFGLTTDEFLELPPYGWVPELSRGDMPRRIEQLSKYGYVRFESPYTLPNGDIGTYEVRSRVLGVKGEPIVLAVGREISGRKRLADDLQLRTTLLDLVDDALIVHETDGQIFYANSAAARLHGYRQDAMLEMNFRDLSLDPAGEKVALSADADAAYTAQHLTSTGSLLKVHVVARLLTHRGRDAVARILTRIDEHA